MRPNFEAEQIHQIKSSGKKQMIKYYIKQYLSNPAYINSSLFDTAKAFLSFYDIKQEQVDLYHYVRWNEQQINEILVSQYHWELDEEITTTWRIGDGTAAFYNLAYYTAAGFTENDTLRSNQIREGDITREEALEKVNSENRMRPKSLQWYFETIGVNMNDALDAIKRLPKLY